MKVVLITPPEEYMTKSYLPPLGIGYLAAVLENRRHEVKIIDSPILDFGVQQIVEEVRKEELGLLGITATSHSRFNVIKIIEGVKDLNCLKILGGVHFGSSDVDALQHVPADIVVRGEGEYALLDIANGRSLNEIEGITYRRKDGQIVRNKDRKFLDVKKLPYPARHLFPMERYITTLEGEYKTKCTSILTSRGCPNICVFCVNSSYWKRTLRLRDPVDVVNEIEEVINTYGIRGFDFWDDTLTVIPKHVKQICNEIIKRNLDIVWYARVRVNTVNRSLLELMKKAGCIALSFGVESGSPRILEKIKKNITLDQVEKVAKLCDKLRFHTKVFFMFNLPGETLEDVKSTIVFMNKLRRYPKIMIMPSMTLIYPGTALEEIAKNEGMLSNNFSWNSPYYNKKSFQIDISPVVPPFENIPFEKLHPFLKSERRKRIFIRGLKELIRMRSINDFYNFSQKAWKYIKKIQNEFI